KSCADEDDAHGGQSGERVSDVRDKHGFPPAFWHPEKARRQTRPSGSPGSSHICHSGRDRSRRTRRNCSAARSSAPLSPAARSPGAQGSAGLRGSPCPPATPLVPPPASGTIGGAGQGPSPCPREPVASFPSQISATWDLGPTRQKCHSARLQPTVPKRLF